jgi:hypothetical protein
MMVGLFGEGGDPIDEIDASMNRAELQGAPMAPSRSSQPGG